MKKYKGATHTVIIEDNNLCIKSWPLKEEFTLNDIISVEFSAPTFTKSGILAITTKKQETRIQFAKGKLEDFTELYHLLYTNRIEDFTVTKTIKNHLEFDDTSNKWRIKNNIKPYNYKDIIEYELLEDGESVTKGGLGRAVAGGILFGGVGAVVGGVTGKRKTKTTVNSLKIKITVNDINNPNIYIELMQMPAKTNNPLYKEAYETAQEILSSLSIAQNKVAEQTANTQSSSNADEIMKYKQLLDAGAITQEEFDIKKKELL